MEPTPGEVRQAHSTRRWPRHRVDLPVRIIALNGILTTPVSARGSEISRAGMALHAPVALKAGDRMQLQFPTSTPSRVTAVVRSRKIQMRGAAFSDDELEKVDLAASLWVVAVAAIAPLPTSSGSKPFSMCRNH